MCKILCKTSRFGKATLFAFPKVYNSQPGSDIAEKYRTFHRHLAHELRNVPGSKQSGITDAYSIGFIQLSCFPILQAFLMELCPKDSIENRLQTMEDKLERLLQSIEQMTQNLAEFKVAYNKALSARLDKTTTQ